MARNKLASRVGRNNRVQEGSGKNNPLVRATQKSRSREVIGLRERKKVRLRGQIIDTSIRLFRERGYENTRIDDIIEILEISQPTFFRYFPTKDAVLHDVGRRGFASIKEHLETELSSKASMVDRLREMYQMLAKEMESDRPLWRAVVLSGSMDPVGSPDLRESEEMGNKLLRDLLAGGQKRGEITRTIPVARMAEFLQALWSNVVRRWAVDLPTPHSLNERARGAVEFFARAVRP